MAILKRVWGFLTAGTSTGVASTFLVMVATGLVGAAVFVYLDVGTQVWNGLSFLPSLATSVIGFLVGVPVAYYVIAEVVSRRDERKELHEVERLTVRGWDDFRDAIDSASPLKPARDIASFEHSGRAESGHRRVQHYAERHSEWHYPN